MGNTNTTSPILSEVNDTITSINNITINNDTGNSHINISTFLASIDNTTTGAIIREFNVPLPDFLHKYNTRPDAAGNLIAMITGWPREDVYASFRNQADLHIFSLVFTYAKTPGADPEAEEKEKSELIDTKLKPKLKPLGLGETWEIGMQQLDNLSDGVDGDDDNNEKGGGGGGDGDTDGDESSSVGTGGGEGEGGLNLLGVFILLSVLLALIGVVIGLLVWQRTRSSRISSSSSSSAGSPESKFFSFGGGTKGGKHDGAAEGLVAEEEAHML